MAVTEVHGVGRNLGGWRAGLVCVLVLAALVRFGLIVFDQSVALQGDPVDYQLHAMSIASGHGYPPTLLASPGTPSAFRPPAYPYLLGGVYALFGSKVVIGRLLGALLGVIAVALLAYLGRAIGGERVGLISGAIGAVFLPLATLNETLLSESLFLPLELGLMLCLLTHWRSPRARTALLAGALCAAAALTRAVAELWVITVVLALVLAPVARSLRLRSLAIAVAAFAIVLAPWTIRNAEALHAFIPISTEGGLTLAGQYNALAAEDRAFEAIWRLPTTDVPSIATQVRALIARPGGIDEAQLNGVLERDGERYLEHHPQHLAVALGLDTLRLFDIGKGHRFATSVTYHELSLPAGLWWPTSFSIHVLAVIVILGLVARLLGWLRFPAGPWWMWTLPLLTLVLTVPMVGNPVKRVPLDPFLIVLAALTFDAIIRGLGPALNRKKPQAEMA
jgi:4-amino-4-deoxy-L-arabinose transferase-like glycosyltransferase